MGFDLNLLVVFRAMMEHRSVTETARNLHLTQPAVSNALGRLRQYFDDDLFVSAGNRMVPTELAERLSGPVRALLADAGGLLTSAQPFAPEVSDRTFVVSASDHVVDTVFAGAIDAILGQAPGIRIDLMPLREDQWGALESGEIDLHVLPREFSAPDHPVYPLFMDSYVILSDRSNVEVVDGMTLEDLRRFPVTAALMGVPRKMRGGFSPQVSARLIDRANVTVRQFSQLPQLIEGSQRIAVVPRLLAGNICKRFDLKITDIGSDTPALDMVAQVNRGRANDMGLKWLIGHLGIAASKFRGSTTAEHRD
jgi:DNA-binding transcriptional LysR family regulator